MTNESPKFLLGQRVLANGEEGIIVQIQTHPERSAVRFMIAFNNCRSAICGEEQIRSIPGSPDDIISDNASLRAAIDALGRAVADLERGLRQDMRLKEEALRVANKTIEALILGSRSYE